MTYYGKYDDVDTQGMVSDVYYPERRETVVGRISDKCCQPDDVYIKIASLVNRVAYLERKIAGLEGVIERYGKRMDGIEDDILRYGEEIDEIERLSKNIGVMTGVILEYPPRGNS